MKTKVLIVMSDMMTGGAQRSLISLLPALDYDKVDVTLALFIKKGLFLKYVPEQVKVMQIPCPVNFRGTDFMRYYLKRGRIDKLSKLLKVAILNRKRENPGRINRIYWETIKTEFLPFPGAYDVAIGYMDTTPTWYVAEKVTAKRKVGFNRNDYSKNGNDPEYDRRSYSQYAMIAAVSEECRQKLVEAFPDMEEKFGVFKNITNGKLIHTMAQTGTGFTDGYQGKRILTVARTSPQKGIDLAMEAASRLKKEGLDFRWYILGRDSGGFQQKAEQAGLADCFCVLPETDNPYPFMQQCDIYAQPSRWEGRCNTIIEAKILGKPIISTRYPTAGQLIQDGVDGLMVDIDAEHLTQGVKTLMQDSALAQSLGEAAQRDPLDSTAQVSRFYQELLAIE